MITFPKSLKMAEAAFGSRETAVSFLSISRTSTLSLKGGHSSCTRLFLDATKDWDLCKQVGIFGQAQRGQRKACSASQCKPDWLLLIPKQSKRFPPHRR